MSDANRAIPDNEDEKSPSFLKRLAQLLRGDNAAAAIRESLEEVIEESDRQSAALSAPERTMLANLLKFGELQVKDVMVPRADIVAVEEKTSLTDLILLRRSIRACPFTARRSTTP
jgi:CBS domain containing-hemolysin-like protein